MERTRPSGAEDCFLDGMPSPRLRAAKTFSAEEMVTKQLGRSSDSGKQKGRDILALQARGLTAFQGMHVLHARACPPRCSTPSIKIWRGADGVTPVPLKAVLDRTGA